jgi:hypothetical protein
VIELLHSLATDDQMTSMLSALTSYVKVAVDVRRGVVAGGGVMHADCEAVLLDNGSAQDDVWGADWYPEDGVVVCESLINIRPRQGNRSVEITDSSLRAKVTAIVTLVMAAP